MKNLLLLLLLPLNILAQQSWVHFQITFDFYGPSESSFFMVSDNGDTAIYIQPTSPYQYLDTVVPVDTGYYTISLTDNFGDGWTSNQPSSFRAGNLCQGVMVDFQLQGIPFTQLDTVIHVLPCPPPAPPICVPTLININLDQYPSETSWNIKDSLGNTIISGGDSAATPLLFSIGATASPTEAMRIDSSGNVLVGTTDSDLGYTDGDSGVVFSPDGYIQAARDSAFASLYLNKLNNDGSLINFAKDGSTVGTIGVASSNAYFGTGDAGIFTNSTSDTIQPFNTTTGAVRDALLDLGSSGARWKDLYLSGKTYLNTTSGAQLVLQTDATRGFIGTSTSHDLILETAGTERMRIDSSGNVGIGLTPAEKLEVFGNIKVILVSFNIG